MRLDLADNDVVITALVDFPGPAVEPCEYAGQYRDPLLGNPVLDAVEARVVGSREVLGHVLLPGREHVDGEMLGVQVGLQRIGDFCDVPEHQWRIQRYGAEAVGGDATGTAVRCAAGHDRDAGCEVAEAAAEAQF